MSMSTFFCSRATDGSLEPLQNIVLSLQGKIKKMAITAGKKSNVGDSELNECADYLDSQLDEKTQKSVSSKKNPILVRHELELGYPVIKLNLSVKGEDLPQKLENLYNYLNDKKESYYSGYIYKIAKKSYRMVTTIEAYLKLTKEDKVQRKSKLAEARAAINDFHDAFKLSQTRNMVLVGLALAIIGTLLVLFAGHLCIPVVVAGCKTGTIGAVIGGGGGTVMIFAGLRSLFFGSTANLEEFAAESQLAAENLLHDPACKAIFPEEESKDMQPLPKKENDVEDEEGFCAWLTNLFNSLNRTYKSYAARQHVDHGECEYVKEGEREEYTSTSERRHKLRWS